MEMLKLREVEHLNAEHTFRTPPWGMLIFPIVLVAIAAGVAWAILNGHLSSLLWASVAIVVLLIPPVVVVNFLPALRSTNWTLKVDGNQIFVMLRNYRNKHFADDGPVVASFPMQEIQHVGQQIKKIAVRGRESTTHWKERRLEIRLRKGVPENFRLALNEERKRRPPTTGMVRSRSYYASPVSCDEETIRILWNGKTEVLKPSINHALQVLGRTVEVRDEVELDRRNPESLSEEEFDEYILTICQSGQRLDAVKLLRRHRGFSLTEASQFVDDLLS